MQCNQCTHCDEIHRQQCDELTGTQADYRAVSARRCRENEGPDRSKISSIPAQKSARAARPASQRLGRGAARRPGHGATWHGAAMAWSPRQESHTRRALSPSRGAHMAAQRSACMVVESSALVFFSSEMIASHTAAAAEIARYISDEHCCVVVSLDDTSPSSTSGNSSESSAFQVRHGVPSFLSNLVQLGRGPKRSIVIVVPPSVQVSI